MDVLILTVIFALFAYVAWTLNRLVRVVREEIVGSHATLDGRAVLLARKVYVSLALGKTYVLPRHLLDPRLDDDAHTIVQRAMEILRKRKLTVVPEWCSTRFRWEFSRE